VAASRDIDELIEAAFAGVRPSNAEIQRIAERVAAAGFDPRAHRKAGGQLAGIAWHGRILLATDLIPTAERHYLKHVVVQEEWPAGTGLEHFLLDAMTVALDPRSWVFVSRRDRRELIGVIGRSSLEGQSTSGLEWTSIECNRMSRHWSTVFRPLNGLAYIQSDPERKDFQWLRHPR